MRLKTRLTTAFLAITIVPLFLISVRIYALSSYQSQSFKRVYGLAEQVELLSSNSLQIFNRLTQNAQEEIRQALQSSPEKFEDPEYLALLNEQLQDHYACLVVRKGQTLIFIGDEELAHDEQLRGLLPEYAILNADMEGGIYLDGDSQHLIKQIDFFFPDKVMGSVFIISDVDDLIPEVKFMVIEMFATGIAILLVTASLLTMWIYRSILKPLDKIRKATKDIRDGNLDFTMDIDSDDELGELCMDFEEMRMRLKDSNEEKLQYDRESKELISNIAHDLKTPITAIKGYAEGIMDGVASSPERLDKYIRTIYNKANDMDRLIDELTFYSKIDTNKIPYTYSKINVSQYFKDCVEEVGLDMEAKGIELGYFNYTDDDVMVIADAEQMKRVINNIISNSVKYLDKKRGIINIRIQDAGDFIQVGIEDNGRGIAAKDLPNIFDRFYRADASRNSSKGGSGIGLSIVRKIIEDHGGRIWATSKEGSGTEVHFVLRKYQEVIQNE